MNGRLLQVAVALASLSVTACGYSLAGKGAFLPAYIKVIAVPDFVNQSTLGNVDVVVTKAVREEFQSRGGKYRIVVEDTSADATLTGTILSVLITPSAFSGGQASRYTVTVTAKVEFLDRHENNKVLWANPQLQFRDDYEVTTSLSSNDPNAYFGQNGNALERLAKNFSRTIVTSILENF